jgi:hypothetical protein
MLYQDFNFGSKKSKDEVAEWLRRWTANPLGFAREGSNPFFVVYFLFRKQLNLSTEKDNF